jgi:hypothetical protein
MFDSTTANSSKLRRPWLVPSLLSGSGMKSFLSSVSLSLFLVTGCVATQDANETAGSDEQEALFPEDGPGDSCALNVPLTCPSDGAASISATGGQISCVVFGSTAPILVRKRPNDVIAVDGADFVRGYELEGSKRERACYDLARKECSVLRPGDFFCQDERAASCIASFDLPDPCEFKVPNPPNPR